MSPFENDSAAHQLVVALEVFVITLFVLEMGDRVSSKLRDKWNSRKSPKDPDVITA